jgi:hypothetical protein
VLTVGQRFADWFLMRQFRITGTVAGDVLKRNAILRAALGLPFLDISEREPEDQLDTFALSWFSTKRSTEAMKRGTCNEEAAVKALRGLPWVKTIHECGMLGCKHMNYLACSPDAVGLLSLDKATPGVEHGEHSTVTVDGQPLALCTVEIKTGISDSSLAGYVGRATANLIFLNVSDPRKH